MISAVDPVDGFVDDGNVEQGLNTTVMSQQLTQEIAFSGEGSATLALRGRSRSEMSGDGCRSWAARSKTGTVNED